MRPDHPPVHPKYLLTRPLWRVLRVSLNCADALPVMHGLVHAANRAMDERRTPVFEPPEEGYRVRAIELRGRIGLAKANDNRSVLRGMATLREMGLVEDFDLAHRRQVLGWTFTEAVHNRMADPVARYGLHDLRMVARLRRPLAVGLYSELAMVRRMRWPRLRMAVEELCFLHDGVAEPAWANGGAAPGWSRVARPTLAALEAVARHEGITILAGLEWSYRLGGVDELSLRLIGPGTRWRPRTLRRAGARARRLVVLGPAGVHRLDPAEFGEAEAAALCRVQEWRPSDDARVRDGMAGRARASRPAA